MIIEITPIYNNDYYNDNKNIKDQKSDHNNNCFHLNILMNSQCSIKLDMIKRK